MTPQQLPDARRGRRTLLLIALVAMAPFVASYATYYWFRPDRQMNYGDLLATQPAPPVQVSGVAPFAFSDGKWTVAIAARGVCDAPCKAALYAGRQARLIQGREMERVRRVWFVTDDTPPDAAIVAEHPDLAVVRDAPGALSTWPGGAERIYLIDPLGNLVLAWPRDPDIKKMAKDLERLLRASRIG